MHVHKYTHIYTHNTHIDVYICITHVYSNICISTTKHVQTQIAHVHTATHTNVLTNAYMHQHVNVQYGSSHTSFSRDALPRDTRVVQS